MNISSNNGFVVSKGAPQSDGVMVEFADGWHIIPQWLVAHLGGTDAVLKPESQSKAKAVTFEEFNRRFHSTVSSSALRQVHKTIVSNHLQAFRNK
ncbi:MAG: hypothetical protein HY231_23750 [Acidobacteria bacterium]|nr:hypothetical protein [Acidobacteriota bacterium]